MPDAETYAWYKAHGICTQCNHEKAYGGKVTCLYCQGKQIESAVKYYQNLPESNRKAKKKRESDYHKRTRQERKAQGICVACGKYPARKNRTLCKICTGKQNRYQAGYRMKKAEQQGKDITPRFKRTSLGKCYICGEPVSDENKNFCPDCLEDQRKKAEHMRKFIDYENHPCKKWIHMYYEERRCEKRNYPKSKE